MPTSPLPGALRAVDNINTIHTRVSNALRTSKPAPQHTSASSAHTRPTGSLRDARTSSRQQQQHSFSSQATRGSGQQAERRSSLHSSTGDYHHAHHHQQQQQQQPPRASPPPADSAPLRSLVDRKQRERSQSQNTPDDHHHHRPTTTTTSTTRTSSSTTPPRGGDDEARRPCGEDDYRPWLRKALANVLRQLAHHGTSPTTRDDDDDDDDDAGVDVSALNAHVVDPLVDPLLRLIQRHLDDVRRSYDAALTQAREEASQQRTLIQQQDVELLQLRLQQQQQQQQQHPSSEEVVARCAAANAAAAAKWAESLEAAQQHFEAQVRSMHAQHQDDVMRMEEVHRTRDAQRIVEAEQRVRDAEMKAESRWSAMVEAANSDANVLRDVAEELKVQNEQLTHHVASMEAQLVQQVSSLEGMAANIRAEQSQRWLAELHETRQKYENLLEKEAMQHACGGVQMEEHQRLLQQLHTLEEEMRELRATHAQRIATEVAAHDEDWQQRLHAEHTRWMERDAHLHEVWAQQRQHLQQLAQEQLHHEMSRHATQLTEERTRAARRADEMVAHNADLWQQRWAEHQHQSDVREAEMAKKHAAADVEAQALVDVRLRDAHDALRAEREALHHDKLELTAQRAELEMEMGQRVRVEVEELEQQWQARLLRLAEEMRQHQHDREEVMWEHHHEHLRLMEAHHNHVHQGVRHEHSEELRAMQSAVEERVAAQHEHLHDLVQASRDAWLEQLNARMTELLRTHSDIIRGEQRDIESTRMGAMQQHWQRQVAEVEQRFLDGITSAAQRHELEMDDARQQHWHAMEELRRTCAAEVVAVEERCAARMLAMDQQHGTNMASALADGETSMEALRKIHQQHMEQQRDEHVAQLHQRDEAHKTLMQTMDEMQEGERHRFTQKLTELRAVADQRLAELVVHEAEIRATCAADVVAAETQHLHALEELQRSVAESSSKALEALRTDVVQRIEGLAMHLTTLQHETHTSDARMLSTLLEHVDAFVESHTQSAVDGAGLRFAALEQMQQQHMLRIHQLRDELEASLTTFAKGLDASAGQHAEMMEDQLEQHVQQLEERVGDANGRAQKLDARLQRALAEQHRLQVENECGRAEELRQMEVRYQQLLQHARTEHHATATTLRKQRVELMEQRMTEEWAAMRMKDGSHVLPTYAPTTPSTPQVPLHVKLPTHSNNNNNNIPCAAPSSSPSSSSCARPTNLDEAMRALQNLWVQLHTSHAEQQHLHAYMRSVPQEEQLPTVLREWERLQEQVLMLAQLHRREELLRVLRSADAPVAESEEMMRAELAELTNTLTHDIPAHELRHQRVFSVDGRRVMDCLLRPVVG